MNVIEQALTQYLRQPEARDRSVAAELRAVPLYYGWTGTAFLTTAGEFLFRDEECDPPVFRPESDESQQLIWLAIAAEQDEWLANLLPERPLDAENCEACAGAGHAPVLCGECHGLGWPGKLDPVRWQEEIASPGPSYVPFDEAISRFNSFAATEGFDGEHVWIEKEDVAIVRRRIYVRARPQVAARQKAREAYKAAVRQRRGVLISAACRLPGGRLGIYVYAPATLREAVEAMYPDGLRLSIPAAPSTAVLAGDFRFRAAQALQRAFPPLFSVDDLLK